MLESRLRIQSKNEDKPDLSVQNLLSCNFYCEGCEGGDSSLVAKFVSEFDIYPESCYEYTATDGACENLCDTSKVKERYSVSDWYYIGGHYGSSTEAEMMKELRARGPFVVSIEPPQDIFVYESGIYETIYDDELNADPTQDDYVHPAWQMITHSVLLVGYGEEENGDKWSKIQNSWGPGWGEGGYFRIMRGQNEIGVESSSEAAIPYKITNE